MSLLVGLLVTSLVLAVPAKGAEESKKGFLSFCSSLLKSSGSNASRGASNFPEMEEVKQKLYRASQVSVYLRQVLSPDADHMIHFPHMMILQGVYHEHISGLSKKISRITDPDLRQKFEQEYQEMDFYSSLVGLEYHLQSKYHKSLSGMDEQAYRHLLDNRLSQRDYASLENLAKELSESPLLLDYDESIAEKLHSIEFIEILATVPYKTVQELVEMWPEKIDQLQGGGVPERKPSVMERFFSRSEPEDLYKDKDDAFKNRALFSLYHATARSILVGPQQAKREDLAEIIEIESNFLKRRERRWEEVQKMLETIAKRIGQMEP